MEATTYFYNLLKKVTEIVEAMAHKKIMDKSFWEEEGYISALHCNWPVFHQSRELKKLGGKLKNTTLSSSLVWSDWYPPKGSHLYKIGYGRLDQLYYLLCLKDGREVFLKQTHTRLTLVDRLSTLASQRLMVRFFKDFHDDEVKTDRIVKKLFKTGRCN